MPQAPGVLPYANARVAGMQQNVIGFDGVGLVMAKGLIAPDRCVKCNAPGDGRPVVKTLYWHHPALFILILFPGLIIYAIVALCVRKSGKVSLSLCPVHRSVRRRNMMIAWGVALLGLTLLIGGPVIASNTNGHDNDWIGVTGALSGIVLILTGAILGATIVPVVSPRKIDEYWLYLKGAGRPFLDSLPRI